MIKLRETLKTLDQLTKRHENEVLRKKRLAFVGISLDNVLHKGEPQRASKGSKASSQESNNGELISQILLLNRSHLYTPYFDRMSKITDNSVDVVIVLRSFNLYSQNLRSRLRRPLVPKRLVARRVNPFISCVNVDAPALINLTNTMI